MKNLPLIIFALTLCVGVSVGQNQSSKKSNKATPNSSSSKNRGPIFRATADQIKRAQAILKERNFYAGDQTGKLDTDTRAGLKKYQQAEGLQVTGTLNKLTLQKMSIELTDKQKSM